MYDVIAESLLFLATDVEGIFRLAGSEKRIKELKVAFDSPDRFGKGLDWTGYTVHDAANILRRYFNQLPEPIIPLEFYERFRKPLRDHQAQAVGAPNAQNPEEGDFNHISAIRTYQNLITELPPLHRQLLLYILDLLAVFASKSDLNKMTKANLAAIFQPGILSHPQHNMAPQEYRLSQDVLVFLIENQDHFLIGMQGTAADAETVRDVQSGTPATTPPANVTDTAVAQTGSHSSVGAESVRRYGSLRRHVSVSSKQSKKSEPGPPTPTTPTNGVHRSNTVPSRRNGSAAQSPRFARDKTSDPSTPRTSVVPTTAIAGATQTTTSQQGSAQVTPPATDTPALAAPEIISPSSSEGGTPLAAVVSETSSAVTREYQTPKKDTTPLLSSTAKSDQKLTDRSVSNPTATGSGRSFLSILKQSPTSEGDGRKPNKLQKRRIPGSSLSSAQSSNQSLQDEAAGAKQHRPVSPAVPISATSETLNEKVDNHAEPIATEAHSHQNPTDTKLGPSVSPPHSSHSQDTSDADFAGDDMPAQLPNSPEKTKRRSRWRLSRPTNTLEQPNTSGTPTTPGNDIETTGEQTMSRTTFSSGGSQPRKSFQDAKAPGNETSTASSPPMVAHTTSDTVFSDSERERKGPMSWIRGKLQDRKDKEAERRAKTPERNHERRRTGSRPEMMAQPEAVATPEKSTEQSPQVEPASVAAPPAAQLDSTPTTEVAQGSSASDANTAGQGSGETVEATA